MTLKKTNRTTAVKNKSVSKALILLIAATLGICLACENPSTKESGSARTRETPEKKISEFERDLETMRTANFDYVFVFRRKDGGAIDGEDKTFLKANLPREINRIILSDDDKAVIGGSHFKFPPENLETLRQRFVIEDYSAKKENEKQTDGNR